MGILQARILEWVAILSSMGSSQSRDWTQVSQHCMDSIAQLVKNPSAMQEAPVWLLGRSTGEGKGYPLRFWPGEFHELYRVAESDMTELLSLHFTFYHLSHQGSPRILEWVAYPFSRASSQSRNQTALQADLQDQMPSLVFGPSFLRAWEVQTANLWSKLRLIGTTGKSVEWAILSNEWEKDSVGKW